MNNIFWMLDVSTNPYISATINGIAYAGYWNDLVAQAASPFRTVDSEEPESKPTATAQGSLEPVVPLTANEEEYFSEPYGGSRPPTW